MTIDEAIAHAREVAEKQRKDNGKCEYKAEYGCKGCADYYSKPCIECAEEHEQLVKWLKDYKRLKELFSKTFIKDCNTCEQEIYEKAYKEGQDKGLSDGHFFGYNKAIDDFVREFKRKTPMENCLIDELAEQLKAGISND